MPIVALLAGPRVNLLLALSFCAWPGGAVFAGLNLGRACFNMLPAGRLDGGRALYCTRALLAGPEWAGQIGRCLDGIWAAVLLVCGALLASFGGNITLLLVSLWLLTAALPEKYWDQNRNRTCHRRRKKV